MSFVLRENSSPSFGKLSNVEQLPFYICCRAVDLTSPITSCPCGLMSS